MSACDVPPEVTPVFSAPWEARSFAMALMLHERGVFTWIEWSEALGAEISRAETERMRRLGAPDDGQAYYRHWVAALEGLLVRKGITSAGLLTVLKDRWDDAARNTTDGEPVLLRD